MTSPYLPCEAAGFVGSSDHVISQLDLDCRLRPCGRTCLQEVSVDDAIASVISKLDSIY